MSDLEKPTSDAVCRHRGSWIVGSGSYEWCYECGALRALMKVAPNESQVISYWLRPVGVGGENPCDFRMKKA